MFSLHWLGPSVVVLALLAQPFWSAPLDEWITLLYVAYGIALIRHSREDWENIALGEWEGARKAALVAGASKIKGHLREIKPLVLASTLKSQRRAFSDR